METNLETLTKKALNNSLLTKKEATSILAADESELLEVVSAARQVRERFFGKRVKLNALVNVKSGLCPEDCHYCSQSKDSKAPIDKYPLMSSQELIDHAAKGMAVGAKRACLVASGRGPSDRELGQFCDSVKALKKKHPQLEVCACLGLLSNGQSDQLKEAGVFAYNHNINTNQSRYEKICGTHTYQDRLDTIKEVQQCGLSPCSGILAGMGESDADLVEMAFTLREKNVDSIPINFLIPIEGTPLQKSHQLTPQKCLLILALFRFVNPTAEIRIAGGRELNLRTLQPLGLMIANSIFIGDYLTTEGQAPQTDLEMIYDLGYEIEGKEHDFLENILTKPTAKLKRKQASCST